MVTRSWWRSPSDNADPRQPTCWRRRSSWANRAELAGLLVDSGIVEADIALHQGSVRFPSVTEFVRVEVKGSPLADKLSDDQMHVLAAESEDALAEFVVPSGEIVMPIDAHIVTARKD